MKIKVKVHLKSRQNKVEKLSEGEFSVYTNTAPEKNRANQAVVELLAGYFDVPKASITIISGATSRHKVVEIDIQSKS